MGVYTYTAKRSNTINVTLPWGETAKAYRLEWFCNTRDLDSVWQFLDSNRALSNRLNRSLNCTERAWSASGEAQGAYVVLYDKVYRWTASRPPVWHDCYDMPATYIGGLVKKGRSWTVDSGVPEND